MKISTRGRYGTRVLLELALQGGKGPVLLKEIAKRQEIPLLYLEHLIAPLKAAGLVRSTRGAKGGIWLARLPRDIKLSDVIQLLEGSIAPVECVDNPEYCHRSDFCATRDIWWELKEAVNGVLSSVTLEDLVERQRSKEPVLNHNYYI